MEHLKCVSKHIKSLNVIIIILYGEIIKGSSDILILKSALYLISIGNAKFQKIDISSIIDIVSP